MEITKVKPIWLVVSSPLKNISQLGWLFPICGKNVPNHQSVSQHHFLFLETTGRMMRSPFFWENAPILCHWIQQGDTFGAQLSYIFVELWDSNLHKLGYGPQKMLKYNPHESVDLHSTWSPETWVGYNGMRSESHQQFNGVPISTVKTFPVVLSAFCTHGPMVSEASRYVLCKTRFVATKESWFVPVDSTRVVDSVRDPCREQSWIISSDICLLNLPASFILIPSE